YSNQISGDILFVSSEFKKNQLANKTLEHRLTKNLDSFYSQKKLGSFIENGNTIFRVFSPSAKEVFLFTFQKPEDREGKKYKMIKDVDCVWEVKIEGDHRGLYYGFKVLDIINGQDLNKRPLCLDPYAKAVTSFTTYNNPRKAVVYDEEYDWEGDTWIQRNWRDLIIYEMHIRDMTAHPSSGAKHPGTYKGLIEEDIIGGINHIHDLGINTVELLPAMEYGNCEIPYLDSLKRKFNNWNPYERNHWGYMTSAFFAPSSYYSENWSEFKWNEWMGADGRQVKEFKDMVKAFHKRGIGVILDVVYNHLSEYEVGNLKQIDKEYYFRLDKNGYYIAQSYCGNDIKSERPMVRRLILDSILYWMTEYHIDGFRFDLGKLLDWETIEILIREARKINPNVVFVCEPWGGGYDPKGFSLREWGSWNDQIRNGIKGENPYNGLGWIFSEWYGNNNKTRIKSYINGTLISYKNGLFQKPAHSVNYLESHDGYTLGDFIRIGSGEVDPKKVIDNLDVHVKLTPLQLKLNKLAALFLFTSQGLTMIHSGQEFARSKVIPSEMEVPDKNKGLIDHNSYDKDNETNYINFKHASINQELLNYYKGLIKLRTKYSAFRRANTDDIQFINSEIKNKFSIGFKISYNNNIFLILMNANTSIPVEFSLPDGEWEIIVNDKKTGTEPLGNISEKINITPTSGMILKLKTN
ncbi:pullulanase, partial [Bacteroidota bacterium]